MTALATTTSVFQGVEETEDGRWYLIDDLRLVSVTTVTGTINKEALKDYAARMAADAAFTELPTVVTASRKRPCGRTYNRCDHDWRVRCEKCPCGECKQCVARWLANRHREHTRRRNDEGRRVHDLIEWWALNDGEFKPYNPDIAPYVAAFKAFIAEYGVTPDDFLLSEAIVVDRDHGYAGTTDGVIRFHADRTGSAAKLVSRLTGIPWKKGQERHLTVDLLVDFKTKESETPRFYPDQVLQVTGYRHAPRVRIKGTDQERPMLPTDGGALVQLRPDGTSVRLVISDDHTYQRGFLSFLTGCMWLIEDGPASVSSHAFVLPETKAARARSAARAQASATNVPAKPEAAKPAGKPKKTAAKKTAGKPAKPARSLAQRVLGEPSGQLIDDIPF